MTRLLELAEAEEKHELVGAIEQLEHDADGRAFDSKRVASDH